jgi:translation initiation factor IF-3
MEVVLIGVKMPVNEEICADEVRLLGKDGEQIGLMPTWQALDAAQDMGLDLVMMPGRASPPTCKMMDYGKFCFEHSKRTKEMRKNQHTIELKEVRFSPNISDGDIETKISHIRKFIEKGKKVRVFVRFKGRENAYPEHGRKLLERICERCSDVAVKESKIASEGRQMSVVLVENKNKIKKILKNKTCKFPAQEMKVKPRGVNKDAENKNTQRCEEEVQSHRGQENLV